MQLALNSGLNYCHCKWLPWGLNQEHLALKLRLFPLPTLLAPSRQLEQVLKMGFQASSGDEQPVGVCVPFRREQKAGRGAGWEAYCCGPVLLPVMFLCIVLSRGQGPSPERAGDQAKPRESWGHSGAPRAQAGPSRGAILCMSKGLMSAAL